MTEKPDYMQFAWDKLDDCVDFDAVVREHAHTLEALDTECAAHEATKAELQALRDRYAAKMSVVEWAINQPVENFDGIIASLHSLLPQPVADPLEAAIQSALDNGNDITAFEIANTLREQFPALTAIGGKP